MDTYYIYGLFNENYPHTYIGYTEDLTERLRCHKNAAKTRNSKLYKYMREVGGEWQMHVLETHECSKKYAIERERYYKELMGDLNTEVPGRTRKERDKDTKERRVELGKIWEKNNPDKMKAKWERANDKKKLNRFTCECGVNLQCSHRQKHEKTKSHIAYETQN